MVKYVTGTLKINSQLITHSLIFANNIFSLINIQMQIIDKFNSSTEPVVHDIFYFFLKSFKSAFSTLIFQQKICSSKKILIYCYLSQCQIGRKVLAQISFEQFCQVNINVTLVNTNLLRCVTTEEKINALRYFLKQNYQNKNLMVRVHPKNFDLSVGLKYNLSDMQLLKNENYMVYLLDNLYLLSVDIKNILKNIQFILNQDQDCGSNHSDKCNKKLKTYINSSAHYAWNIMEQSTKSELQKNTYNQKKKIFRASRRNTKQSLYQKTFNSITSGCTKQIQPFFSLKVDEDEELSRNYLNFSKSFKHDEKILNQIEISETEFNRMKKGRLGKFIYNQKKLLLMIDEVSAQDLQIQKSILRKLPEIEFIGLPRYYFIKNRLIQQKYRLSNLYDTIDLDNFLVKNKEIISSSSKLNIINKISNTLRYLRDNFVLYHNLVPSNIKIKKGLLPKLVNFTNSFGQDINLRERKNIFPFVSNEINQLSNTEGNQKSDSYSLGILMYYIFYGKNIFYLNQAKLLTLSEQQKFNRLNNKGIIGICREKKDPFFQDKLIFKFILDAVNHQSIPTRFNEMKLNLKERPYLDWFSIITKQLQNQQLIN